MHLLFGSLLQVAGWGHPGWGPNWKPAAAVQSVSSASSTTGTTASATGWTPCAGTTPCPGGPYYYCLSGVAANGCRPAAAGPFPTVDCDVQCDTQADSATLPPVPSLPAASTSPPPPSPSPPLSPSPSTTSPIPPISGIALCTTTSPCPSGSYYHCLSGPAINGCKAATSDGPFPTMDCTAQCLTQGTQVSCWGKGKGLLVTYIGWMLDLHPGHSHAGIVLPAAAPLLAVIPPPPVQASSSPPLPRSPPSSRSSTLIWSDEFSGGVIDGNSWTALMGDGTSFGVWIARGRSWGGQAQEGRGGGGGLTGTAGLRLLVTGIPLAYGGRGSGTAGQADKLEEVDR